jgi:predicted O-methyltransferase YrrM
MTISRSANVDREMGPLVAGDVGDAEFGSAVLLLIFNRPDTTGQVMEAIRAAQPSRLYVAADGPCDRPGEAGRCKTARQIATAVDWPCRLHTLFREQNLGCRLAVRSALDWFFDHESEGIILEDDCLPSQSFFRYCTELLQKYRNDTRVMSVSGSDYLGRQSDTSYYYSIYHDPWGWATWRRAWKLCDHEMKAWPLFLAADGLRSLSDGDLQFELHWRNIFEAMYQGRRLDTWDYPVMFTQFAQRGLTCRPCVNMVKNIGHHPDAVHTKSPLHPLGNLPNSEMGFPLRHPAVMIRDLYADKIIGRWRFDVGAHGIEDRAGLHNRAVKPVKQSLSTIIGPKRLGIVDYLRFSKQGDCGPFNGQRKRQELFVSLIQSCQPSAIIETGTYRGASTEFMSEASKVSVYSIETSARNFSFAKMRLRNRRNVRLLLGDSRKVLLKFFEGEGRSYANQRLLFYLDAHEAHHAEDHPLAEELTTILLAVSQPIIMIDDFQVPDDPGYDYDIYGVDKVLSRAWIARDIGRYELTEFYPRTPSTEETGSRRGCVVLARNPDDIGALSSIPLLRKWLPNQLESNHRAGFWQHNQLNFGITGK